MAKVKVSKAGRLGYDFVPREHLAKGQDEYTVRNEQVGKPARHWKKLTTAQRDTLLANGNTCDDWSDLRVARGFDPSRVHRCRFSGLVRLGRLDAIDLTMHGLTLPAGISDSHLIACDIGDNVVIRDVHYLAHTIVGDHVMLVSIDELHTTNHAKFGNGIVKRGEDESVRVMLDLINEAGGREVAPFDGMTPGDAYLWARYRGDAKLMKRFDALTQSRVDSRRGYYSTIGCGSVIKSCRIIKDVAIGQSAYIKGANKLKNLTINSTEDAPAQIGEGVELVNGIIGRGCRVFYGCKAVRFVMGDNANLKYGARLIHSVLGDNSTVSCCELLNNLIFPAHEQHHNNSFLIASLVKGQSNLAAGATVGSNHNSRANDGEVHAGRGFWPGLGVTVKHSSRFASFTLLGSGDYRAELNVPLPFALISDDPAKGQLNVMPAFWWLYNMYALARNTWKFNTRDKRVDPAQHIEFDALAPDTVEETLSAMTLLEAWTAKAHLLAAGKDASNRSSGALAKLGRSLLMDAPDRTASLQVLGEGIEHSRRPVVILKPRDAYHAYREMVHHYAVTQLLDYLDANPKATLATMRRSLAGSRQSEWINVGGQLISQDDLKTLIRDIKSRTLDSWDAIHARYDALWKTYPRAKRVHAMRSLEAILGVDKLTPAIWKDALTEAGRIQDVICKRVEQTRAKDYTNPFRVAVFENADEMAAVVGTVADNSFVKQVRRETRAFRKRLSVAGERS